MGKRKGEKSFQLPKQLVDDGAVYLDGESEKEQVYEEKPFLTLQSRPKFTEHIRRDQWEIFEKNMESLTQLCSNSSSVNLEH